VATARFGLKAAAKPNNPARGKPHIGGLLRPRIIREHRQCPARCNIVRPPPCDRCIHGIHGAHGAKPPLNRLRPLVDLLVTDRFGLGFRDPVLPPSPKPPLSKDRNGLTTKSKMPSSFDPSGRAGAPFFNLPHSVTSAFHAGVRFSSIEGRRMRINSWNLLSLIAVYSPCGFSGCDPMRDGPELP
jgi:hypothetical protein